MKLPRAKNFNAEKYVAGLSLFKQKFARIKLSANESALGPSPKAVKEYIKVSKNFKRYPDSDGTFLRRVIARKFVSQKTSSLKTFAVIIVFYNNCRSAYRNIVFFMILFFTLINFPGCYLWWQF